MNRMLSGSFKKHQDLKNQLRADNMEVGGGSRAAGNDASELDRFLYDVEAIKEDMRTMEKLQKRLQESNEDSKNVRDAATMKELRAIMDSEVDHVLILAKAIMKRLEGLDRSIAADRKVSGPASSLNRTRTSVVVGLGKKLRDTMDEFQGLRAKMAAIYKEAVEYRYVSLTGEKQYIETIENLLGTGEIMQFLTEAVQEYGRDRVVDVVGEIQERREGAKYMQKCLIDLHQTFLDMVSLVEAQGQKGNQNEQQQMLRGSSYVRPGAAQLQDSGDYEKDAKKRATIALFVIVVLIVILIVPLFKLESERGSE